MLQTKRGRRYPIWNPRPLFVISVPVFATITVLVVVLSDRSVLVEFQIALAIISLCIFAFFAIGLFSGARLIRPDFDAMSDSLSRERWEREMNGPGLLTILSARFAFHPPDPSEGKLPRIEIKQLPDRPSEFLGWLINLVTWIVMLVLIVLALYLVVEFIAALPVMFFALYWLFYRALRAVLARSRSCKGKVLPTLRFSLLYTALYSGWILALLSIARWLLPVK